MLHSIRSTLAAPALYQMWSNAAGGKVWKTLVSEYIRPGSNARILDIGCGPGTLVPYLPQSGYLGFDLSSKYIATARKRFPNARFECERVSEFSSVKEQDFDLVLAIGIIHHLDDWEAIRLFQIAHQALKPEGRLVTVDGVFTDDQSPVARWLLKRDRGEHVRMKEEYVKLASQVFDNVKPVVRHDLLRIPYSHLILECVRSNFSMAAKTA